MPPDPFQTHLDRAAALFDGGDVVQAGQIWQAILKRDPGNAAARAGLFKVKQFFDQKDFAAANDVLLQEGCTLFDMGQVREALLKWERILTTDPGHKLALAYANDARRELGLEPIRPPAQAGPPGAPESAARPGTAGPEARDGRTGRPESPAEEADRLVLEGVQIFDLGMAEEAMAKWERALQLNPDHPDAPGYMAMARREQERTAAVPSPTGSTAAGSAAAQWETQIWRAEQSLREGRVEEAAQAFQRLLGHAPKDHRILQGYHQARALLTAREEPKAIQIAAPIPVPATAPAPVPRAPVPSAPAAAPRSLPAPVGPPRALTVRSASQRDGFSLPAIIKGKGVPRWLATPRNLALALGAVVLVFLALLVYGLRRREAALKEAVATAKLAALRPVSRAVQVPSLAEATEDIRREAEQALTEDPLLAYFRAEEFQRRVPDDPGLPHLIQRAKDGMEALPPAGDLAQFEQALQGGDLDRAKACILGLLRHDPDDLELRGRARRVLLALAPLLTAEGHLGRAREALLLGRAMYPQDPGWQARLKLLDALQAMPASARAPWIQLLG
ncbi:MAG: hypothetical protein ABSH53_09920 [Holophaga sp.]|jgi:tetratricopeptide (TPR) repeat protein